MFGHWLKQERERRGWSQRLLADKAGISSAMVTRLESGKVGHSPDMVQRLVAALTEGYDEENRDRVDREARAASAGLEEAPLSPEAERFLKLWESADPVRRKLAEEILALIPTMPEPLQ